MGYVTKTITETLGEASVMTSYHFETYEDFLKFENDQDIIVEDNTGINLEADEDGWVKNPGYQPNLPPENMQVDVKFRDGGICHNTDASLFDWSLGVYETQYEIEYYKPSN